MRREFLIRIFFPPEEKKRMGVTHQGAASLLLHEAKRCASSPAAETNAFHEKTQVERVFFF